MGEGSRGVKDALASTLEPASRAARESGRDYSFIIL
jgi:hypothetical protein